MFFWGALRLVNIGPISHNCLAIYNNNIRTVRLRVRCVRTGRRGLLKTCCFGCRKVKRGFILFLLFSWVVVGYNLERWWAGWKQFVRRQGCAFGKRKTFSSSPCSPQDPSLTLCSSNEHHSSVIKSNSHVFFCCCFCCCCCILSISLSRSLYSLFLSIYLFLPFTHIHTQISFAFSPHIPPTASLCLSCSMGPKPKLPWVTSLLKKRSILCTYIYIYLGCIC
jgi:hypothetical protein